MSVNLMLTSRSVLTVWKSINLQLILLAESTAASSAPLEWFQDLGHPLRAACHTSSSSFRGMASTAEALGAVLSHISCAHLASGAVAGRQIGSPLATIRADKDLALPFGGMATRAVLRKASSSALDMPITSTP